MNEHIIGVMLGITPDGLTINVFFDDGTQFKHVVPFEMLFLLTGGLDGTD